MNFNIIKKISSGSFGIVYLIKYNNDYAALKRINLNDLHYDDYRRQLHELNILFFNNSPYLLKGLDININNSQYLEIVTPYYDGGTLENFILTHKSCNKQINSTIIKNLLINLCMGIKYLHDNDIIHRDLKPANILIDNKIDPKKAIIIDFGISTILNNNKTDFAKTKIGTPYFMSPEQVEINKKYNSKCDVWALGCILYELVTLDKPFRAVNIQSLNIKIIKSDYKPIVNTFNDLDIELFKKIIQMCLIKCEDRRASIDDILEISEIKKKIDITVNKKVIPALPCGAPFNVARCAPVNINKNFVTKIDIINYVNSYNKKSVELPALPCGFINARVDKCAPKIVDNNIYRPSYIPNKLPALPCGPNDQFAKCAPALPCGFINARVDKCAPKIIDNNIPVKTPASPCESNVVKCAPALPCGFINARVDKCAPKIIDNKRYPNLFRPSYIPVKTPALPCGFIKACVDKCAPPKIINRYYLPKVVYGDSNNGK
jgi:serine/threonine protein kinase